MRVGLGKTADRSLRKIGMQTHLPHKLIRELDFRTLLDDTTRRFSDIGRRRVVDSVNSRKVNCDSIDGSNGSNDGSSDDIPEYVQDIEIYTACLMDLSPAIERVGRSWGNKNLQPRVEVEKKEGWSNKTQTVTPPPRKRARYLSPPASGCRPHRTEDSETAPVTPTGQIQGIREPRHEWQEREDQGIAERDTP